MQAVHNFWSSPCSLGRMPSLNLPFEPLACLPGPHLEADEHAPMRGGACLRNEGRRRMHGESHADTVGKPQRQQLGDGLDELAQH